MRVRTGLVAVLFAVAAVTFGAVAVAGDDPAARLDDLAKKLLASDPAVREQAEKDLGAASAEDLRGLVRLLRDRMDSFAPTRDPFVGADIPQPREKPADVTQGMT